MDQQDSGRVRIEGVQKQRQRAEEKPVSFCDEPL